MPVIFNVVNGQRFESFPVLNAFFVGALVHGRGLAQFTLDLIQQILIGAVVLSFARVYLLFVLMQALVDCLQLSLEAFKFGVDV